MKYTPAHLFCLRAAASRAARKCRRFARRFYGAQHGLSGRLRRAMFATLQRLAFRAEAAKYAHSDAVFTAACESQRHDLSCMQAAGYAIEMEVSHAQQAA